MAENKVLIGYAPPWQTNPEFLKAMYWCNWNADKKNFIHAIAVPLEDRAKRTKDKDKE